MKFFQTDPQAGKPISMKGFAEGLRKMAKALERIEVANGHVEWTAGGAPRLFFDGGAPASVKDPATEGGGGSTPTGYTEREDTIIDIDWNYSSNGKIRIKRGTVLVKDDTETDWTDLVTFEEFNA